MKQQHISLTVPMMFLKVCATLFSVYLIAMLIFWHMNELDTSFLPLQNQREIHEPKAAQSNGLSSDINKSIISSSQRSTKKDVSSPDCSKGKTNMHNCLESRANASRSDIPQSGVNQTETISSKSYQANDKLTYSKQLGNSGCDVTVVTAYIDIGSFHKGGRKSVRTPYRYFQWAKVFKYIKNPLIVYTDSPSFLNHIRAIRLNNSEITKVFFIDRLRLPAFKNVEKIRHIFSSKSYPKKMPSTSNAEYVCIQHAKYDLLEMSAVNNTYNTKYFMWLDIGYFRDLKREDHFRLCKPNKFNEAKIAMSLVKHNQSFKKTPYYLMRHTDVLVCGCIVFGTTEKIIRFSKQYAKAVDHFLKQGLANTDQTILYSMMTEQGQKEIKQDVQIQFYKSAREFNWFFLGYSMMNRTLVH